MENRAFIKWLMQTPWLALLGATGLVVLVLGFAQSGVDFIGLPGWELQAIGAVTFAVFLLLNTYFHQQGMDKRLSTIEARADDLREQWVSQFDQRVEKLAQACDAALEADDELEVLRVRPKLAAAIMSIEREYQLGIDTTSAGDSTNYVMHASSFLITAWPFIRDGHMGLAREAAVKYCTAISGIVDDNGLIKPRAKAASA